ncbi:uncharacterized protein LOC134263897 isoform X2 [Saccostrea cucullata]|uniref:uncharacterized protein LOC134263897 isoform X2 n=1 Tax=Saccostrea cuccullata TaxID=36930 RepID=UPI002ED055CC
MDALFTLSDGNETVKFDGNNFTVKGGDCSTAGEYQSVLTLTNSNEDFLVLTFNALPDLSVNMSLMFIFAPFEFFPGTPITNTISLLDTGDLKLGSDTQLYQCESIQRMTLIGELEGTTYTMTIVMSNVQIQAFNIRNGNLSTDVFVCSADQMKSTEQETTKAASEPTQPTTEPSATTVVSTEQTTFGPSNVTTEGPTTALITVSPTTPPALPFPNTSIYEVMENSKACLIMAGSFQLKVTYMTKENRTVSLIVDVPASSDVTVGGTCASGNDTESSLTITPKDGGIQSLTFNFTIMDGKSYLYSWSAGVYLTKFPDVIKSELIHSVNGTPVELSSPKLYYKCIKGGAFSDDILAFMFREFQVQAFNVEDGKFSGNGYDCEEDIGPIPRPGNPPVNMFVLTDKSITCIVLKDQNQFNIPYMSYTGNATEVISLPERYTVTGDCNTKLNGYYSQKIVIGFYNSLKFTIYFSSDVQKGEILAREKVTKYRISQIELDFDFNNNLFKDVDDSILGTNKTAVTANLNALTTNKDQSYTCKKESTFNIQNGISMTTKELQFQAFKTENSTAFSSAVYCKDNEDNNILLISTGAALGGLLLLVVVLVIIHKKRQNYEQLTH